VSSAAGFSSGANVVCALLAAIASGNIVVFWLFARAVFDDAFELRPWHVVLWAVLGGVSLGNCLSPSGTSVWPTHIFGPALGILSLVFIALAIAQTIKTWSDDLVEGRRQVRAFVVIAAAGFGVLNAAVQLLSPGGRPSTVVSVAVAAILLVAVAAIAPVLTRIAGEELFGEARVAAPVTETAPAPEAVLADRKLVDALNRMMTEQRIYRHDGLSIGVLATKLGVPEYKLRRLINGQLGYRNFNAFLNGFRIEEARVALADPSQAEVPVTTIALDAGFQSIGPFNRAFSRCPPVSRRANTGATSSPRRFLKLLRCLRYFKFGEPPSVSAGHIFKIGERDLRARALSPPRGIAANIGRDFQWHSSLD
jgi:AraC-like DNA-binding protein